MSINLEKNKESMLASWKEVVNEKSDINWALYGYDGKTNELKMVSKGDGGLEELIEDLNCGKIMYAFCRVLDPNTSLPKFVLIHWQGEAAPLDRKGTCANHIYEVKKFFKGAHLTITARTEDDVDANIIIDKVSKSTASAFNFSQRSKPEIEKPKPVGSVYKRIIPASEINAMERDKFWEKEEAEEKKRLAAEQLKAEETRRQLDDERRIRELEEAKSREEKVKERMRTISQLRHSEKLVSNTVAAERERWERENRDSNLDELERRQRSESLRNERKQEAQELISKRSINARAIFEQNSSAGQMSSISNGKRPSFENVHLPRPDVIPASPEHSPKSAAPNDTVPPDVQNQINGSNEVIKNVEKEVIQMQNDVIPDPQISASADTQHADNQHADNQYADNQYADNQYADNQYADNQYADNQYADNQYSDAPLTAEHGLCARALYDYQAADDTEISFDPDDIISQIDQIDEGWWQGLAPDGTYGLFPANYVELLD